MRDPKNHAVEIVDWLAMREEAALIHKRLRQPPHPNDDPAEIAALIERGRQLQALGFEAHHLYHATSGDKPN